MDDEIMTTEQIIDEIESALFSGMAVRGEFKEEQRVKRKRRAEKLRNALGRGVFVPEDRYEGGGKPDPERYKFVNNEGTDFNISDESEQDERIIGQTPEEVIAERFLAGDELPVLVFDYDKTYYEVQDAIRSHVELKGSEQGEEDKWHDLEKGDLVENSDGICYIYDETTDLYKIIENYTDHDKNQITKDALENGGEKIGSFKPTTEALEKVPEWVRGELCLHEERGVLFAKEPTKSAKDQVGCYKESGTRWSIQELLLERTGIIIDFHELAQG